MILCQEGGKQIVLKNAGKSTKRLSDEDDFYNHTERRRGGIIMKTGGCFVKKKRCAEYKDLLGFLQLIPTQPGTLRQEREVSLSLRRRRILLCF